MLHRYFAKNGGMSKNSLLLLLVLFVVRKNIREYSWKQFVDFVCYIKTIHKLCKIFVVGIFMKKKNYTQQQNVEQCKDDLAAFDNVCVLLYIIILGDCVCIKVITK